MVENRLGQIPADVPAGALLCDILRLLMVDPDADARLAAFSFVEQQTGLPGSDGAVRRDVLIAGFHFAGRRISLMSPQQGIFKPASFTGVPLSITTVPVVKGKDRPYDDVMEGGRLRYKYRGSDPQHRDNAGIRQAMQYQIPLIYFHGIVPGVYVAEWPVYVIGDDPKALTFTVTIDERRFASLGSPPPESEETEIRRRYVMRTFKQRLHQREFRERVVRAYQNHCAVCRLRRSELLEGAHIIADSDPLGMASVRNGLSLCKLHHAAFDANLIGIGPDYIVQVRNDVLNEKDGPMLIHGLQGFHSSKLWVPRNPKAQPDPELLERRFSLFRKQN